MGDFNAHFDDNHVALDSRASLVGNLSQVAGLVVMNWQPQVVGNGHGAVRVSSQSWTMC